MSVKQDLIDRLRGRVEMNLRTAAMHPDETMRAASAARVTAYKAAIKDVEELLPDTVVFVDENNKTVTKELLLPADE